MCRSQVNRCPTSPRRAAGQVAPFPCDGVASSQSALPPRPLASLAPAMHAMALVEVYRCLMLKVLHGGLQCFAAQHKRLRAFATVLRPPLWLPHTSSSFAVQVQPLHSALSTPRPSPAWTCCYRPRAASYRSGQRLTRSRRPSPAAWTRGGLLHLAGVRKRHVWGAACTKVLHIQCNDALLQRAPTTEVLETYMLRRTALSPHQPLDRYANEQAAAAEKAAQEAADAAAQLAEDSQAEGGNCEGGSCTAGGEEQEGDKSEL